MEFSSRSRYSREYSKRNENKEREDTQEVPEIKKWDELDVSQDLLRGIYSYGFEHPSPIQAKAIRPIIEKHDVVAQAQSGTGKTAAFTIGLLSRIDLEMQQVQAIVLAPTRELATQITQVIQSISEMMTGFSAYTLVGGKSVDIDIISLQSRPPHTIVSCPGRLYDILKRGVISTENVKIFVVDEADEMLSAGFIDQLQDILYALPQNMQMVFFSATYPRNVSYYMQKMLKDPVHISVKTEALTLEGIGQYYVALENDEQKYETLKDLYSSFSMSQCIIYCNSIERVSMLSESMLADGFPVCCIHSNMPKMARERAIKQFREGKKRVLISSNVTARGIDIQQVGVVINFDVCKSVHTYLHRIGRSGRWGRKGIGINFVTFQDAAKLRMIEKHYATQIEELPVNFMESIK